MRVAPLLLLLLAPVALPAAAAELRVGPASSGLDDAALAALAALGADPAAANGEYVAPALAFRLSPTGLAAGDAASVAFARVAIVGLAAVVEDALARGAPAAGVGRVEMRFYDAARAGANGAPPSAVGEAAFDGVELRAEPTSGSAGAVRASFTAILQGHLHFTGNALVAHERDGVVGGAACGSEASAAAEACDLASGSRASAAASTFAGRGGGRALGGEWSFVAAPTRAWR